MQRNFPIWFEAIDQTAILALRIAEFRPAATYINPNANLFIIRSLFVPLFMSDKSG